MIKLDPSFDDHLTASIIVNILAGETVQLVDTFSYIFAPEYSLLNDPRFLFQVLDPVFERLPMGYVLDHLKFSIDNSSVLLFCAEFWIRTEMEKWWNDAKY